MPGTVLGTWDIGVNEADQNPKCHGANIHPPRAYMELSSESVDKLVEFILCQMQLCGQEKKVRQERELGGVGMGKSLPSPVISEASLRR